MNLDDLNRRMQGAISVLKGELAGLRTGRASSSMLDPITVNAYGTNMPLSQLATVSVPEPRMINVQVWDRGTAQAVEKAIRESSLGLNPIVEGQVFRIPIPELNADRRKEFVKVAHKYAEAARISVRHVRRDGIDSLKKSEADGLSEDESRKLADKIQKLTDETIAEIDAVLAAKEAEILHV
ncbi:ribosome recycling factor [Kaistia dalseonensis]|uniref:Ribosome-recycling factor n=1 Tax=Kaistia dalseonensis TaxID=410840 RepID=A0ABU0H0Z4_9HYPH|nr:ribosome recycling factor [Kaistia dalseonensis]MCX5493423.1 ribosome recycling factor [Kaistia dalseonensis]MDQ0435982.1 ribosome recycling factor [Kaistia dalseonensis]